MGHQADTPTPFSDVPRQTRLLRRGSRYYLRAKVPIDLQAAMKCKEIKWSLGTSDPKEAARLINFESAKADSIFDGKRRELCNGNAGKPTENVPASLRVVSEEHAQELARAWFGKLERESAKWWEMEGRRLSTEKRDEILEDLSHFKDAATGNGPDWKFSPGHADGRLELKKFLNANDLVLGEEGAASEHLRMLLREASLENIRREEDRIEGKPFRCYDPLFEGIFGHTNPTPKRMGMTVGELGEKFLVDHAKAKKAPKTLFAYEAHVRLLSDIFGPKTPVSAIKRGDVERLCGMLEEMPSNATKRYPGLSVSKAIEAAKAKGDTSRLAVNSRRNYFFNMFTVFGYAVEIKALEANPFDDRWLKARFTPKENGSESEVDTVSFLPSELQAMFNSPLYTGCQNDESGYMKKGPNILRRGRFWIPLVALFQGLRLNEICQLYSEDVRMVEGELVFEVRSHLDGGALSEKRLKNKASARTVPVHPELLKMGFYEFVESSREDGSSRLFPEIRSARKSGSYSDVFSKWFSRFLVQAIGRKPDATFHSFRHGWRDALRRANVSLERVKMLGGWTLEGQDAKYGRAKIIQELKIEIAKVEYPGLEISHLYVP